MGLRDRTTERLAVKFTDKEKIEKGSEIAELFSEVAELKDDIKSMKKGMEAQIAEKEARINKISEELRTGQEFRSVDCQWVYDFDTGIKYLIRLDSNATAKEEPITDAERQTKLELDNPEPAEGDQVEADVTDQEAATQDEAEAIAESDEAAEAEAEAAEAQAQDADEGRREEEAMEAEAQEQQ